MKNQRICLIDSHCHLHFTSFNNLKSSLYFITSFVICGVSPGQDWLKLSQYINNNSNYNNNYNNNSNSRNNNYNNSHNNYNNNNYNNSNDNSTLTTHNNNDNDNNNNLSYSKINIRPQFGLHPWWIERNLNNNNWEDELKEYLERYLYAGVGECGLDKTIKRKVNLNIQKDIVKKHIQIAKYYNRPVTFHCVQAWGTLLSLLQEEFKEQQEKDEKLGSNVNFILHSCNSLSPDLVNEYLKLSVVYFSFNGSKIFNEDQIKLARKIPHNRLLIESDSPDQKPDWILPPMNFNIKNIESDVNSDDSSNTNHNKQGEDIETKEEEKEEEEKEISYIIQSDPLQDESVTCNEPVSILHACYLLSEALNVTPEYIAKITTENSKRVFWFN